MTYSKILVCCDGSKYSEKAIKQSCELAKLADSQLFFIYVVDKMAGIDILDRKEILEMLRKFGKRTLEKAQKIAEKQGVKPKIIIKEGRIAHQIISYAKKEKCDLIIVGNKGLGTVAKIFLGSISSKLANHSDCSVLIVK